jgi:hypothetical protein
MVHYNSWTKNGRRSYAALVPDPLWRRN